MDAGTSAPIHEDVLDRNLVLKPYLIMSKHFSSNYRPLLFVMDVASVSEA